MAKFAPQYNPHKTTSLLRSIMDGAFWFVFALSSLPLIIPQLLGYANLKELISIVNVISILLFFILEIVIDFILFPQAEQKRRDDFIDNSFGSKFSPVNSIEYYDNEEVSHGLYKTAANLFENTFFTFSLVKELTLRKIILPSIVFISVWVFAYFGFRQVPIALSVLQILFSANILGNLIKHLILLNKLNNIQDSWISVFQHDDFKSHVSKYQSHIYRNWLQYEALLSRIQAGIPDKVFNNMNKTLTQEWQKIKIKYSIK